ARRRTRRHDDARLLAGPAMTIKAFDALPALAALALAATFLDPGVRIERRLFEHVVVLDITQSMNVTDERLDGKPASRLAFAKHALRESLLALPCGSKVGWAVFTEYRS